MFISEPSEYKIISIYPHLNEAPTRETFITTRIEVFERDDLPDMRRPIRFGGSWYSQVEMLELAAACQKAAEMVMEGAKPDDKL